MSDHLRYAVGSDPHLRMLPLALCVVLLSLQPELACDGAAIAGLPFDTNNAKVAAGVCGLLLALDSPTARAVGCESLLCELHRAA
jgi:hypothetical protein